MKVVKVFDNIVSLYAAWDRFVNLNTNHIESLNQTRLEMVLLNGDKYLFRVIKTIENAWLLAGIEIQVLDVDYSGRFAPDVLHYLRTRVRMMNKQGIENE